MPQKLRCEVEEVIQHGERVYSLILRPERPIMRFIPGQFLHLTLEDYQPGDFWLRRFYRHNRERCLHPGWRYFRYLINL